MQTIRHDTNYHYPNKQHAEPARSTRPQERIYTRHTTGSHQATAQIENGARTRTIVRKRINEQSIIASQHRRSAPARRELCKQRDDPVRFRVVAWARCGERPTEQQQGPDRHGSVDISFAETSLLQRKRCWDHFTGQRRIRVDVTSELPELRLASVVVVEISAGRDAADDAAEAVCEETETDSGLLSAI